MSNDPYAFFLPLLEEGAPDEAILSQVSERAAADSSFVGRLAAHVKVYRNNLREDVEIPLDMVDVDGTYAQLRARAREVQPRLDRLLMKLVGNSPN